MTRYFTALVFLVGCAGGALAPSSGGDDTGPGHYDPAILGGGSPDPDAADTAVAADTTAADTAAADTADAASDVADEPDLPEPGGRCEPPCRAGEQCFEGVCLCVEGAQRPCGVKAGICEYGSQVCDEARWTECVGGTPPEEEVCDGLDNDCDGVVDEDVCAEEPDCEPPPAPRMTICPVSWDRRPVVEFTAVPDGVRYDLFMDEDILLTTIDAAGQNHWRPDAPLGPGGPLPGAELRYRIRACLVSDPQCCAPEETAFTHLVQDCTSPIAPSADNVVVSEYLINGDGGNCPGDDCEAGEALEITNLSHCPVALDGHHFRYCNNDNCTTWRFMDFGPDDIIPPRGVYVVMRNPERSVCEFPFLLAESEALFGLKISTLEVEGNRTNTSGWFNNGGGGSLRVATGDFDGPASGQTIARVVDYLGGSDDCQGVGFDAVDACGDVLPGAEPTRRLRGNQLGRLWHPCDAVVRPNPDTCRAR